MKFKGNECINRAIEVALSGNHSIAFIGYKGCGKTCYIQDISKISNIQTFESRPCDCGNFQNPNKICNCSMEQIQNFQNTKDYLKCLDADIILYDIRQPREEDLNSDKYFWEIKKPEKEINTKIEMELIDYAKLILTTGVKKLGFNMTERNQILSIAKTIALMEDSKIIQAQHISEAIQYKIKI